MSVIGARDLSVYLPVVQARWLDEEPDRTWRDVDGSVVFADLSGFTPLTERLARLGKVSAEELTATLNRVVGRLLGIAEWWGGDLLKFGGDALLLLFTGPDHAARASAAAAGMQEGLRPFRRLQTRGGRVSLKMSVGVSSGRVLLFLVGDSHRELLAAGPVISAVVRMETAADADEILLSPATAEQLPSAVLGVEKDGGVLLRSSPDVRPRPLQRPALGADVSVGVPLGLRDHLRVAGEDGEHRITVLTFVQFTGTDDLLQAEGPAAVALALDRLVRAVQDACERHGACFLATDLDRNGGRILLVAGAPAGSTEDEDRTLHTLLDVVAGDLVLSVRAGVNRGRSFAVDVGSDTRRTYAVMGDATNLAARVMGTAEPGTIVATASVLDHTRTLFDLTALEPFMVKGKSDPIEAMVVGPPVGQRRREDAAQIVGRDEELALLKGAVDQASEGRGGIVELIGEPGVGKSRLLAAFRACAPDSPTLEIEGAPYASHTPYLALRSPLRRLVGAPTGGADEPVIDALESWVVAHARDLAPWLPLLALPLGLELPDTPDTAALDPTFRSAKLRAVTADLMTRALPGFALVPIEDAHWLDGATSDFLSGLLDTIESRSWAVCMTRRDVEGGLRPAPSPAVTTIALGPLSVESARSLLQQATEESPLPGRAVAALAQRSGGNPLFLHELLATAQAGGEVDELPDTIEALIAARIDTLAASDRSVLRHAAVLGGRFSSALLEDMLPDGLEPLPRTLPRLERFIVRDDVGMVEFRHALLREVAYEGLPFQRRRELHGRAGALVEKVAGEDVEEWSDLLSLHYSAAQRHDRAWLFARMAGDRARRQSDPADAAVFYRRAVQAAGHVAAVDPSEVAAAYEALGDVHELTGQYELAADAYRRARRLARDHQLMVVELFRKEGYLRERSARYAEALRWYSKGLRVLDDVPPSDDAARARAKLTVGYGFARLRQGRYTEAIPFLERAAKDAEALGDLGTLAHAYNGLDWAHTDLGSDDRHRYRQLALPIFEELGDLKNQGNVYNNLGVDAYYEGRWGEALELYERSRDAWERSGDVVQIGSAANNIGEILSDQGRLDDAGALFGEALQVWRAAQFPVGIALATSNLARLDVRRGVPTTQDEAREAYRAIGAEGFVLETKARDAERLVAAGEGAVALALIEETEQEVERLGSMPVLRAMLDRLAGYALAQAGEFDAAVKRLRSSLGRSAGDYELALTLDALARLGVGRADGTNAVSPDEAAGMFSRLGVMATLEIPLPRTRDRVRTARFLPPL